MNLETIRTRVKESRPFTLVTSSGNRYPVPHQDFVFFTVRTIVVADQKGDVVVLDPLHVVGLEDFLPRKNGGHKRKGRKR